MPITAEAGTPIVNGAPATIVAELRLTLLDALRDDFQLTGTKTFCNMGDCGACTVLVVRRAVYSFYACLTLAVDCGAGDHVDRRAGS